MILAKSRQLTHCPPHFARVTLSTRSPGLFIVPHEPTLNKTIRDWLHENCENRFFIGHDYGLEGSMVVDRRIVGFENDSDATFFSLKFNNLLSD